MGCLSSLAASLPPVTYFSSSPRSTSPDPWSSSVRKLAGERDIALQRGVGYLVTCKVYKNKFQKLATECFPPSKFEVWESVFRIRVFFLSPDPDRPKIRIRIRKIRIRIREKNVLKLEFKQKKIVYFIYSTLNMFLFGQALPKPYQNHHLDPTVYVYTWTDPDSICGSGSRRGNI